MAESSQISTINISHVLRTVWMNEGISRTEIADVLTLNKSTISKIIAKLIQMNIVESVREGKAGPSGGRKPIHLRINKDYGFVLGIEIETDAFTAIGLNLTGEILFKHSEELGDQEQNLVSVFFQILRRLNPILDTMNTPLIGIGIGLPGIIDPHEGIIYQSKPMKIAERIDFYNEVSHFMSVPLLIEKDANCCCWGELAFGENGRPQNFLYLLGEFRKQTAFSKGPVELAVGFGFVIDGNVHYGDRYSSGEFLSVFHEDGNWNAFALTDEEIAKAEEDPEIFHRLSIELSKNIALLVNTLNLSHVITGGNITNHFSDFKDIMLREIQKNWPYDNPPDITIAESSLGEDVVAYGAASMFIEKIFCYPELTIGSEKKILTGIDLLNQIHKSISS